MVQTFHNKSPPPTKHGHELPAVEVPVAPVGAVAVECGVLLVVVGRLRAKRVNHPDVAPAGGRQNKSAARYDIYFVFKIISREPRTLNHIQQGGGNTRGTNDKR